MLDKMHFCATKGQCNLHENSVYRAKFGQYTPLRNLPCKLYTDRLAWSIDAVSIFSFLPQKAHEDVLKKIKYSQKCITVIKQFLPFCPYKENSQKML